MKKLVYLFAGFMMFASSCTITKKTLPTASLNVQVNLDMNDLEFIGTVSGTAEQYYVLGMAYGGRKNYAGVINTSGAGLATLGEFDRAVNNALYDALLSKPDADFILPLAIESKEQKVFLGKTKKITVRGKAFKIKTK